MRVLLSAYACEPNRGSEPEVGWQRALHMLAVADEVWVLTRANNRTVIEADPRSRAAGLHFLYYDLPGWALGLKKRGWFLPVYFMLWQWGACRVAARRHREKPFDAVYHVTFASLQHGSWMGRLGIPFVIGPIAGGERAPLRLRRSLPFGGQARELLRDLGIFLQRISPLTRPAFAAAERIYVTTAESLRLVPSRWRSKTTVHLAIATDGNARREGTRRPPDEPCFVFAGNLLHLKGVHLAIRALALARETVPQATLTLIGDGPAGKWLRTVAIKSGVAAAVSFAGRLPRGQLQEAFGSYTALVFPSLHDTGGMVVLEALAAGLPAICLDLGGPGILVNRSCGVVVPTAKANEAQAVAGLARAMIALATISATEWERLSQGAVARANELSWAELTRSIAGGVRAGRNASG
ncbi:MAG: glycosyltransferase family 4 protein [Terracidiphilus sp.]